MINQYFRPENLEDAFDLLNFHAPKAVLLGGGTFLSTHQPDDAVVIDLQGIKELRKIEIGEDFISIGSQVTLQQLADFDRMDPVIRECAKYEAGFNIRQMATIAGCLVCADGRSPLATCFNALETSLSFYKMDHPLTLGNWISLRDGSPESIMKGIQIRTKLKIGFDYVARSPRDLPIVCAAVCIWPGGRTRVVLGGYGKAPLMVLDGPDMSNASPVAREAYREAEDSWGSGQYRSHVSGILVDRIIRELTQ